MPLAFPIVNLRCCANSDDGRFFKTPAVQIRKTLRAQRAASARCVCLRCGCVGRRWVVVVAGCEVVGRPPGWPSDAAEARSWKSKGTLR
jgi:hypothetical protein